MQKKLILILMTLLILCNLSGCSKEVKVSVKNGAINFNDTPSEIMEWCGSTATREIGDDLKISYYLCDAKDVEDCPHNTAGVVEDNMTKFKKAKYYEMYLGTYVYMFYPCKGGYIEGNCILREDGAYSKNAAIELMYNDMASMSLSEEYESVSFEDKVDVLIGSWGVKARPNEIVIPSLVRVRLDDGKIPMTSTTQVGGVTVGTTSTTKYTYYKYDNILIQLTVGVDVEQYVRFRE